MSQRRPHQSKRETVLSATGSRTSEQSSTGPVDGIAYLRHRGYEVIRDNRYCLSAKRRGREVYRCVFDPGGGYFWRHVNGTMIGDSITLVCREEQIGLRDAIDRLALVGWSGRDHHLPVTAPNQRISNGLRLPTDTEDTHRAGQRFLHDQGISGAIMNHAEAQGALSYAARAVVFVGYNGAFDVRSVTWLHYARTPVRKRIARGSDVSYPTVLHGDARLVWLVDEGLDGLALLTTLRAIGLPLPTVIVTNAAAGRQVLWRQHVHAGKLRSSTVRILILDPDWIAEHVELLTFLPTKRARQRFRHEIDASLDRLAGLKADLPPERRSALTVKAYATIFPYVLTGFLASTASESRLVVEVTDYIASDQRPRFTVTPSGTQPGLYEIVIGKFEELWRSELVRPVV